MKQRIFLWLMVLGIMVTFSAVTVYSGTISLPKTGQTLCYDNTGATIPCAGTGQDGDILAGVNWPVPRFTNLNGSTPITDSCVVDQLTGLTWARNAEAQGNVNWQEALDYANALTLCTYTNWRLPSINELESLINYGSGNNPITYLKDPNGDTTGFLFGTSNGKGYFWTSTTYFRWKGSSGYYVSDHAWAVSIRRAGTNMAGFWWSYWAAGVPKKTDRDADFEAAPDTGLWAWPVCGGPDAACQ